MAAVTVGIDLAKSVFQMHGVDADGRPVFRRRLSRGRLMDFFVELPPCRIGMEACSSAHHWARQLVGLGADLLMADRRTAPECAGAVRTVSLYHRPRCRHRDGGGILTALKFPLTTRGDDRLGAEPAGSAAGRGKFWAVQGKGRADGGPRAALRQCPCQRLDQSAVRLRLRHRRDRAAVRRDDALAR